MATILTFAKRAARRKRATRIAAAEIVIFPGVRVEYHDEARSPTRRRKLRKTREAEAS
jgi:hypothetical protein